MFSWAVFIIVVSAGYVVFMVVLSRRPIHHPESDPADLLFIFVVPCLNEELVIGQTIERLLSVRGRNTHVIVIDDGSTDETAAIAGSYRDQGVTVLTRRLPNAAQGKGRALNEAFNWVRERVEAEEFPLDKVVLGIVDADGLLDSDVLGHMAGHFADPGVGAIQIGVRISQRGRLLRQLQDFEFVVFARVIQKARNHIGSVGLGGNGQFTRLSALASLGADPWSDCLTEDLDLGLRLVSTGWKNAFCPSTNVTQQGLDSVRRLVRQRTRWSHGHLQCWKRIPELVRSPLPTWTVLDLIYYLLAPSLTLLGTVVLVAPFFWLITVALLQPNEFAAWATSAQGRSLLVLFYTLSFGTSIIWSLVYRRISGEISVGRGLLLAHMLPFYNLIWHLATWRAVVRILLRRQSWTKTDRAIEIPTPNLAPSRVA